MIYDLIRDGFSVDLLINLCARVFIIFCVMPIHEFAHAFVANKLGDQTARLKGRLTINPLAHIDPLGALMIILAGFGWAKPVPVNMRNFKNRKGGMALTACAGPLSNLVLAYFLLLLSYITMAVGNVTSGSGGLASAIVTFLYYAASINVTLAVFNLIPVPPLDGSRIATMLIPDKYYYKIMQYERYIVIAVMALVIFGVFSRPLSFLTSKVMSLLIHLASFPLKFV